jgi:hypothetical protein
MAKPKLKFVKDDVRDLVIEECARAVPTNWCDSLLTGPKAVVGDLPGSAVERLLLAVAERIRGLKSAAQ